MLTGKKRECLVWAVLVLWATLIFATVSLTPLLQRWIATNLGRETFTLIVLVGVVAALVYCITSVWRNPEKSWKHLLWLLAAGAALIVLTVSLRKHPQEAIHILEFGVLGGLSFVALSYRMDDPSIYVAAAGVTLIVGILDETLQWAVRGRIWDLRDIYVNASAGALALVAVAKGLAPGCVRPPVKARGVRLSCSIWSTVVLLLLLSMLNTPDRISAYVARFPILQFLQANASVMVEYGYLHEDPSAGLFRSRFTPAELSHEDAQRAEEAARILDASDHQREAFREFIRVYSPLTDPFLHEARVRLHRRDQHLRQAQKLDASHALYAYHQGIAFHENLIMERYFGETLKRSRYWLKPDRRAELERYALPADQYVSPVSSKLITRVGELQVAVPLFAVLTGLLIAGFRYGRN